MFNSLVSTAFVKFSFQTKDTVIRTMIFSKLDKMNVSEKRFLGMESLHL